MALQSYLEFGDPDFPAFHRYDDDAVKWGGPNVDNQYLRARVDGHGVYRITGNVAGVRDLILSTNEGDMQLEQYGVFEERRLAELDVAPDGTVEIALGGDGADAANHLPLHPDTTLVLVRVYVVDWHTDGLPWFDIERLDRATAAPPRLDDAPSRNADRRGDRVGDAQPRVLERLPRAVAGARGGEPAHTTACGGRWVRPHRVRRRVVGARSRRDARGRARGPAGRLLVVPALLHAVVREPRRAEPLGGGVVGDEPRRMPTASSGIAVGARDPGIGAWLDTEGRRTGMVSYRLIGAARTVTPTARVTADAQPWPDRVDVDPETRAARIRSARRGIARRFHR